MVQPGVLVDTGLSASQRRRPTVSWEGCQQVEGGDRGWRGHAWRSESTFGLPSPRERLGYTGERPTKGHQDDEATWRGRESRDRSLREVVASPSLEILKNRWVTVLDKQLVVIYLSRRLDRLTLEVPSRLTQPAVVQERDPELLLSPQASSKFSSTWPS